MVFTALGNTALYNCKIKMWVYILFLVFNVACSSNLQNEEEQSDKYFKKTSRIIRPTHAVKRERPSVMKPAVRRINASNKKLVEGTLKGFIHKNDKLLSSKISRNGKQDKASIVKHKQDNRVDRSSVNTPPYNTNDINTAKLDKILNMLSSNWDIFKWENSMLTEIAQTISYLFTELREQEKRIKRLNRNVKNSLKVLLDGQDIDFIFRKKGLKTSKP